MAKKWQKNTFFIILSTIFIILSCLLLTGCGEKEVKTESIKFKETHIEAYLNQDRYLDIEVQPAKADPVIIWSTSDKSIVNINRYGRLSAVGYGEATITATVYKTNISTACTVTVTDGRISYFENFNIEIKLDYFEGEKVIPPEINATGYYESGKSASFTTSDFEIDYPELAKSGEKIIIDSPLLLNPYEYELNIKKDYVNSISIKTMPSKTTYYINETFDKSGLEIEGLYASGKTEIITDFTYSTTPLQAETESIEIIYKDYKLDIPITARARTTARNLPELKEAIDNGVDSVLLVGSHNTPTPLVIENASNVTIVGDNNSSINGYNCIPVVITGQIENVKFVNIKLTTLGDDKKENLVDFTSCTGGSITFQNVNFVSTHSLALILPEETTIATTFINCKYAD